MACRFSPSLSTESESLTYLPNLTLCCGIKPIDQPKRHDQQSGKRKADEEGGRAGVANLGGAPELEVGGGDDEEMAVDDLEVDDPIERGGGGGGGGGSGALQGDDLGPSICHVHLRLRLEAKTTTEKKRRDGVWQIRSERSRVGGELNGKFQCERT